MSIIGKDQADKRWLLDDHEKHWHEKQDSRLIGMRLATAIILTIAAIALIVQVA